MYIVCNNHNILSLCLSRTTLPRRTQVSSFHEISNRALSPKVHVRGLPSCFVRVQTRLEGGQGGREKGRVGVIIHLISLISAVEIKSGEDGVVDVGLLQEI